VIIDEDGKVVQVQKMRGDEPFVAAATAAVKTWRYHPAMQSGKKLKVFRLVKIPFQLNP
jgi:protein TonB